MSRSLFHTVKRLALASAVVALVRPKSARNDAPEPRKPEDLYRDPDGWLFDSASAEMDRRMDALADEMGRLSTMLAGVRSVLSDATLDAPFGVASANVALDTPFLADDLLFDDRLVAWSSSSDLAVEDDFLFEDSTTPAPMDVGFAEPHYAVAA